MRKRLAFVLCLRSVPGLGYVSVRLCICLLPHIFAHLSPHHTTHCFLPLAVLGALFLPFLAAAFLCCLPALFGLSSILLRLDTDTGIDWSANGRKSDGCKTRKSRAIRHIICYPCMDMNFEKKEK